MRFQPAAVSPAWPNCWSGSKGVLPIASVEDLVAVDDTFESEEEYEAFLADLYASRRAGLR